MHHTVILEYFKVKKISTFIVFPSERIWFVKKFMKIQNSNVSELVAESDEQNETAKGQLITKAIFVF